jgi:hypothetical protein
VTLAVAGQEAGDAGDGITQVVLVGQEDQPEVVGLGQLKPVPCTSSTRSASSSSAMNCWSSSMGYICGSSRGNMYSVALGLTQVTPGIAVISSWARSRWRRMRPPGATRSSMLW